MMGYGREATTGHSLGGIKETVTMEQVHPPRKKSEDISSGILEEAQLAQSMPNGLLMNGLVPRQEGTSVSRLPPAVAFVPKDDIRSFLHHKRVGNYLLGRTLGEGSFAKVKEGMHALTGEKVAVKVIDKKKARADTYVSKNMRREARILQTINHPSIIQLYEIIETENSYYLVTELCSGGELMQHIYKHQYLNEGEVRKYIRQIVSAVDYLHKSNIIHRDLKVENLLLDDNMNIKIIDFGLSNLYEQSGEDGSLEYCTTQCGSPAYAAPELLGQKKYGPEVDTWSIGVNMYAMLTGCLPYTVEPFNITALHAKMLDNKMNEIPSRISEDCRHLMCMMLNPKPESRISMEEIFKHPWLLDQEVTRFEPHPYPNTPNKDSINMDIVSHIVHQMRLEKTSEEMIIDALVGCKATTSTAIYKLMERRLSRYLRTHRPRRSSMNTQRSKKSKSLHGSDLEDIPSLEPYHDVEKVTYRKKHISGPSKKYLERRRMSAPVSSIEEDLTMVSFNSRPTTTQQGTRFPIPHIKRVQTDPGICDPQEKVRPITVASPRNNPVGGTKKIPGLPHKQNAWDSSRRGSVDLPEARMDEVGNGYEKSDLSRTLDSTPRSSKPTFSIGSGNLEPWTSQGLPNISHGKQPSSGGKKKSDYYFNRTGSAKRKVSIAKDGRSEISTKMPLDAIAGELVRVVSNMNYTDLQLRGSNVFLCEFHHTKLQISLCKDLPNLCQLQFEFVSGGDYKAYREICKEILRLLEV